MATTKEKILTIALQLFAKDSYETVSVSIIAGALGMTKGALHKHIVGRMEERDAQRAAEFELPEGMLADMTEKILQHFSEPVH